MIEGCGLYLSCWEYSKRPTPVDTGMETGVRQNVGNFLTFRETSKFSERNLLYWVSS
jgi:hypothetical protein